MIGLQDVATGSNLPANESETKSSDANLNRPLPGALLSSEERFKSVPMTAINAIYRRQSIRNFTNEKISESTIRLLLETAVHAPTALHEEPWAFVIIQDKKLMNRISESVRETLAGESFEIHLLGESRSAKVADSSFNAFYNAETLILICGNSQSMFSSGDCWLAAENLMLAAYAEGIGTCIIGCAVPVLNSARWKTELEIPNNFNVVTPLILGIPLGLTQVRPRKRPQILRWI